MVTQHCQLLQIFMLFLALAYGCQQRPRAPHLGPLDFNNATTFGQVIVDGGLHKLWPCLIPWVIFEATMGYAWLHNLSGRPALNFHTAILRLVQHPFACSHWFTHSKHFFAAVNKHCHSDAAVLCDPSAIRGGKIASQVHVNCQYPDGCKVLHRASPRSWVTI